MVETDEELAELPLDGAGTRLRRAREAAGLQLSDIAARTRISERHLITIENGNFSGMASRAYAVGFARSYARVVGLDEQVIGQAVRDEMDGQEPGSDRYQPAAFEPGDPARVPSARIAWLAALAALALIVAGTILWRSFYAPAISLPDPAAEATATGDPQAAAPQTAAPGPVVAPAPAPTLPVLRAAGQTARPAPQASASALRQRARPAASASASTAATAAPPSPEPTAQSSTVSQ